MIMAFKGNYPTSSKIVIDGTILEQTSYFNYLGSNITFKKDDVFQNLHTF
jgi:hypothetical protein